MQTEPRWDFGQCTQAELGEEMKKVTGELTGIKPISHKVISNAMHVKCNVAAW